MSTNLKFLTVIDPHASDRNPIARLGSYFEDFFNKLEQIKNIAKNKNVDYIIFTGDLFSAKEAERNSHKLTSNFIKYLKDMPCPVYGILGNHDLYQNRYESWPQQPVSNLIESKAYLVLDHNPIIVNFNNGKSLKIRGKSFNKDDNYNSLFQPEDIEYDYLVHVSHFAVDPLGGTYSKYSEKMWSYDEIYSAPPNMFILGHIHTDHGITEKDGKYFIQHGSLMRSTTHCYNLNRDIKIGYIEIDQDLKVYAEEILLNVKSVEETFCMETKLRKEMETQKIDEFIELLSAENPDSSNTGMATIEDILDKLKDSIYDQREEILELYYSYLNKVQND